MLQFLISTVLTQHRTACWAGPGREPQRGRWAAVHPGIAVRGRIWDPALPSSSGLRGQHAQGLRTGSGQAAASHRALCPARGQTPFSGYPQERNPHPLYRIA